MVDSHCERCGTSLGSPSPLKGLRKIHLEGSGLRVVGSASSVSLIESIFNWTQERQREDWRTGIFNFLCGRFSLDEGKDNGWFLAVINNKMVVLSSVDILPSPQPLVSKASCSVERTILRVSLCPTHGHSASWKPYMMHLIEIPLVDGDSFPFMSVILHAYSMICFPSLSSPMRLYLPLEY